jgi:hypothetical protein
MVIPIPDPLCRWPEIAKTSQIKGNTPADDHLELMEELVNAKAWIKMHPEVPYDVKASMLLQIDAKFESWARDVPPDLAVPGGFARVSARLFHLQVVRSHIFRLLGILDMDWLASG